MNRKNARMKKVNTIGRTEKQNKWRDEQTKQYNIRLMYDTGIPAAIEKAAEEKKETVSQYIKKSIVMRLSKEGYIEKSVVINRTEEKHMKRIQRLKEYIAAEEEKQNRNK